MFALLTERFSENESVCSPRKALYELNIKNQNEPFFLWDKNEGKQNRK